MIPALDKPQRLREKVLVATPRSPGHKAILIEIISYNTGTPHANHENRHTHQGIFVQRIA